MSNANNKPKEEQPTNSVNIPSHIEVYLIDVPHNEFNIRAARIIIMLDNPMDCITSYVIIIAYDMPYSIEYDYILPSISFISSEALSSASNISSFV